jgi:hypothetical protein
LAKPSLANSEPARSEPAKPEPLKFEQAKTEPPKSEPLKVTLLKPEPPKPAPPKVAALKPVPIPPPVVAQSSPSREETDDAQSVLARLRQLAPGPGPASATRVDVTPPIDPKSRPVQPVSLPGLAAARAALANGKVEDARRLLQQAQLQLVFRPVSAAGDDSPAAGKGAADVARALDALSANDVPLSRRYIDIAVNDLAGTGTNPPGQDTPVRTSGYAPAYPPRY